MSTLSAGLSRLTRMYSCISRGAEEKLLPGDFVVASGNLDRPGGQKNPGSLSQEESFRRRGLIWSFRSMEDQWSKIRTEENSALKRSPGVALRRATGLAIEEMFEREEADFLKGILLGERGNISDKRRSDFSDAGIYHVLAISGLHIGIISGILYLLFSILRLPPLLRVVASIPVLLSYGVVTGMRPSVQRAIVMISFLSISATLQRKVDIVNLLYAIAVGLVYLDPSLPGDPGFQMSFLATWGIVVLYPGFARMLKPLLSARFAITRVLFSIVAVSICAQLPLIPVIASSFHKLSIVAPLSNVVAIPTMAVLFPSALLSVCAHLVYQPLSVPFAEVSSLLVTLLLDTSALMSRLPAASLRMGPFDVSTVVIYFALLYLTSMVVDGKARVGSLVVAILLGCNIWLAFDVFTGEPPMRVTFLDVGQGDGAVFQFPSGEVMIMDGGPEREGWNAGERIIEPFLLASGIRRIDILAFSHPQLDHLGGLPFLISGFDCAAILDPGQPTSLRQYSEILRAAIERDIPVYHPRRGDSFREGDARVEIMHPGREWVGQLSALDDINDVSLVARLTYGKISLLMTGDIERAVEEDLVHAYGTDLNADILKVAHHGSASSSTVSFLSAVNPSVAVVSVGRDNRFGHPDPSVMEMMGEKGIEVFRTDLCGAVVLLIHRGWYELLDGSGAVMYNSHAE